MPDPNIAVRSIPLPTVFEWLGVDVSKFKTRKGGTEWYGKCFFHDAKTNNTALSFTAELANCFSCGVKFRGAIDAVMAYRKVGFKQAVEWLQEQSASKPSPPPKKEPVEAPGDSSEVLKPYSGSYEKFKVPCEWLEKRIPDAGVRERYGVFCYENKARKSAYSGRVMIPVKDIDGHLYGYLGRSIHSESNVNEPKYLFPKNLPKSKFLFGAAELKADTSRPLPLKLVYGLESPLAVLKFASLGLPAVSFYGWCPSAEQILLCKELARGLVVLPDRNRYQEAFGHAGAIAQQLWCRLPELPAGVEDPEYLTREQILALIH